MARPSAGTRRRARIWPTLEAQRGQYIPCAISLADFILRNHYVPNRSVLVALEPGTYRDAIAAALALLRPGTGVIAVDPAHIAAALLAHHPVLVFLSDPSPAVEAEVPAWVLLHPSGANRAIATLGSVREEIDQPRLADLVALLDRALTLVAPWTATSPPRPLWGATIRGCLGARAWPFRRRSTEGLAMPVSRS